jgi:hypothetical protein
MAMKESDRLYFGLLTSTSRIYQSGISSKIEFLIAIPNVVLLGWNLSLPSLFHSNGSKQRGDFPGTLFVKRQKTRNLNIIFVKRKKQTFLYAKTYS